MNENMIKLFRNEPRIKVLFLINLKNNFAQNISRETGMTLSTIFKSVKMLRKINLIEEDKTNENKRKNILKITNKGKEVVELLNKLNETLK